MPKRNLFFSIIFLRIAVPADIISYAIGLFTDIRFIVYSLATFIGYAPLAFLLAYAGTLPIYIRVYGVFS